MSNEPFLKAVGLTAADADNLILAVNGYERGGEKIAGLTTREMEVFACYGRCMRTRAIADKLGIALKTLDIHRDNVKKKLGVSLLGVVRAWAVWNLHDGKTS